MKCDNTQEKMEVKAVISKFLRILIKQLTQFLEKMLPSLFEDWWDQAVLNSLPFQQKHFVEQNNISSLKELDLDSLLRIFDKNWSEISIKLDLTEKALHFVKETRLLYNRWAYMTEKDFSLEGLYRDLVTLHHFSEIIGPNDDLLKELCLIEKNVLAKKLHFCNRNEDNSYLSSQENKLYSKFEPGQIVFLKSNPNVRGAVISIIPSMPENLIKVFVDNEVQTFYSSQLQAEGIHENENVIFSCEEFQSYLTALHIRYPGVSTLYSLNAARIDFIPYQFRPVLRFIRSDRPRLLIADGVGVGKTIEAGLILRELQARHDIRSVLIICPRPLIIERKWQNEMKRFDERFSHLDGRTLRYCIQEMDLEGVWPEEYHKAIIPYSLFDEALLYGSNPSDKRKWKKGLLDLDPPPRFDLVIVDEAHHIRNQNTYSHKAVRFFCDYAGAVVFLTATPIQLGSQDLFVLLNVLRPDLIIDQESYEHMAEPNPFINKAVSIVRTRENEWPDKTLEALVQAANTNWGKAILRYNPEFTRICSRLAEGNINDNERIHLVTEIENLYTFAGIINRTRRRDIGNFTMRKPETVAVEFTPAQKNLHDELLQIQAEIFSRLHGDVNIKFMMTTIRRQAASCIFGLVPFLEDILNRHIDELLWEEADDTETIPKNDVVLPIQTQIQTLLNRALLLDPYDPKLEALYNVIRDKQNLPNNKLMLFSSFRHTLHYLYKNLVKKGFRVGMVHGDTPEEERVSLRNRFEKPREDADSLDLLLFSEVGCEGLDYQFCDCIVNYDLPWNPMRVEQRIGRIDRKGQKSETVTVINMVTPGTVDADIYERCLLRIGVFNNALGSCEEILGEITREIKNIAENYILNTEERRSKLKQLADNKIRLIQEQEALEERQMELFGIHFPEDKFKKEIEEATSYWLSPKSIYRLVNCYLKQICEKEQDYILGEKPLKTLRLSQDARNKLLHDFQHLPKQNTIQYREWMKWLKEGNPHLLITFESDCALNNHNATFIMPHHPLVKQAANIFDAKRRVITKLKVQINDVPTGEYEFAIYQWRFHGIKEDLVLCPVAKSEVIKPHLTQLLEKAKDFTVKIQDIINVPVWKELDEQHYKLWSEAREKHRQRTQELAEYRRESLSTSHRSRLILFEEQLKNASDEKIKRMRQSQILAAEADYKRHIQDIDIAVRKADIIADLVAIGILYIEGGNNIV
jgi:ATP-dependent helicase HepA